MKKESRSQTRSTVARQQTFTRNTESIVATRKQSRKVTMSAPVTYGAPSKDSKCASKSRSTDLSTSSGKSQDIKQSSASDIASDDTAVSAAIQKQQQPDTVSDSAKENVSSPRKEKAASRTPDRSALKSRRWVRGGPIEYSTPPSDHGSAADKQKSSCDSKKGKSLSKKNIALAFEGTDKEAEAKQRSKDSDSAISAAAGGKRKKDIAQHGIAESKGFSASKGTSRKKLKNSPAVKIETETTETTRTKRMARLNAEAIVSLIYKHDEQVAKSSKYHDSSDSDIDTDSSESSSDEEHIPAAKKKRATGKILQSREDLTGTSKNVGEQAHHRPGKKSEMNSAEKQSLSKSEKSPKRQQKISSKSCKKKPVEAVSSSSWSPPKRMASLNAQVFPIFTQ